MLFFSDKSCARSKCGCESFGIEIQDQGIISAYCRMCGKIWQTPNRKPWVYIGSPETMGSAGDEPSNMVSATTGKAGFDRNKYQREYLRLWRANHQRRKT